MNTRNQTRCAVTLASLVLVLTAACVSEAVVPPADSDTATETRLDDNPARLDFRDNGLG